MRVGVRGGRGSVYEKREGSARGAQERSASGKQDTKTRKGMTGEGI